MSAPRRYPGRRLLATAIRAYQRFLSGRGPMKRVICTFMHTESCSAYGLRAAETLAHSLPHALGLIRARIRMCGSATLYRLPHGAHAGSAPGLVWGDAHDREPLDLEHALCAAGELPETRAAVLRARAMVARQTGDVGALRDCVQRAGALTSERSRIVVRKGDGLMRALRLRLGQKLVMTALFMALVIMLAPAWITAICALGAADLVWQWTAHHVRRSRRMERLAAAAMFQRPVLWTLSRSLGS